jgi:signal transduction histidine kinase
MATPNPPLKEASIHFIPTFWKIIIILISGLVLSSVITFSLHDTFIKALKDRVNTQALAVDANAIRELKDTTKSDGEVPYAAVKARLSTLKQLYDDTRFIYLMSRLPSGEIVFLADSESENSAGYSPRNEIYTDATPALKAAFSNKETFIEGPVQDDYGIWYSALAPIVDSNGQLVAIIGSDVPLERYGLLIYGTGLVPFLIAVIASIMTYFFDRSRRQRLDALRFQIEMMSMTSHELQSPIRGILWGEKTLMKTTLDESQRKLLQAMLEGTAQLENSVDSIVQLDSMQLTIPPNMTNIDLASVIQDVAASNILAARQRNISMTFAQSWPTTLIVHAEASTIQRCFNSILASEIKNTKEGGELQLSYELKDGTHMLTLASSTMNLSRDELGYIFDYSHQTTKLAKNKIGGSGMGMFIARTIIEQFGGHIKVSQAENSNEVRVTVDLPVVSDTK